MDTISTDKIRDVTSLHPYTLERAKFALALEVAGNFSTVKAMMILLIDMTSTQSINVLGYVVVINI